MMQKANEFDLILIVKAMYNRNKGTSATSMPPLGVIFNPDRGIFSLLLLCHCYCSFDFAAPPPAP